MVIGSTLGMNSYFSQVGLTTGTWYTYQVKARNYIGFSPLSSPIRILAANPPSQPLNLRWTNSTTNSVQFTWSAPLDSGGTPVRDYWIYWD